MNGLMQGFPGMEQQRDFVQQLRQLQHNSPPFMLHLIVQGFHPEDDEKHHQQ
ncbi:hypothetical protein D3C71_2213810 [compost metagenome]